MRARERVWMCIPEERMWCGNRCNSKCIPKSTRYNPLFVKLNLWSLCLISEIWAPKSYKKRLNFSWFILKYSTKSGNRVHGNTVLAKGKSPFPVNLLLWDSYSRFFPSFCKTADYHNHWHLTCSQLHLTAIHLKRSWPEFQIFSPYFWMRVILFCHAR